MAPGAKWYPPGDILEGLVSIAFNPPMAKGEGGGCHPPRKVFRIFLKNGKASLQTKF